VRQLLTTLVLILAAVPGFAQAPFSTLEFRTLGSLNINQSLLHTRWHPARGIKWSIATPFYAGDWDINLGIHRFDASADVPGFRALWISSGWGFEVPVHTRITLKQVIRIGNYRMSFDDASTSFSGESSESDFVGSAGVLGSFKFSHKWFLFAETEYLRVQTQPLMHLWFTSAGIGYRIQTGKTVKTFLE